MYLQYDEQSGIVPSIKVSSRETIFTEQLVWSPLLKLPFTFLDLLRNLNHLLFMHLPCFVVNLQRFLSTWKSNVPVSWRCSRSLPLVSMPGDGVLVRCNILFLLHVRSCRLMLVMTPFRRGPPNWWLQSLWKRPDTFVVL